MCDFKLPFCVKSFPQTRHLNGFSPVCILMCVFRWETEGKLFPQMSHVTLDFELCGFPRPERDQKIYLKYQEHLSIGTSVCHSYKGYHKTPLRT